MVGLRSRRERGLERWFFPQFNVTVAYHRAVLLMKYQGGSQNSQQSQHKRDRKEVIVDVDIPADDCNITNFMMFLFSIPGIVGTMISSKRRHLLFSVRQGSQWFHHLEFWMALGCWRAWSLAYRKTSHARPSSFGDCSH